MLYVLQAAFYKKITGICIKYGDDKPRMRNVYGCQETNEPKKLHYETQQDNRNASQIKRELQESQRSHPEEREKEKQEHLDTIRDGEQERSIYTRWRNGNLSTKRADVQIKRKN
jgi:hypothetical protein